MTYDHVVKVTVTTQFKKSPEQIATDIQTILGPWCLEATAVAVNIPHTEEN